MQKLPLTPQAIANLRKAFEAFDAARYTEVDYTTKRAKLQDLLMIHAGDLIRIVEQSTYND